jgi:hypothetical protein
LKIVRSSSERCAGQRFGDPAQAGFSSPVTLRCLWQAHWLDERHQDLICDLGEQLIESL